MELKALEQLFFISYVGWMIIQHKASTTHCFSYLSSRYLWGRLKPSTLTDFVPKWKQNKEDQKLKIGQ